ncbi:MULTISPECIES: hypothetical protein [unclassified Pseudomonas]|uniref:hypothetical protein n=1 Tax=unclassified Pseudomonas TaxID=196821 RepID=UPI00200EB0FE|nr:MULTISPECIES: hypothetical protein [unclassified Pseudomonas]
MKFIKLMPDYECHPLWNISPDEYGDLDPLGLPISDALKSRLKAWATKYDETLDRDYPPNSGFKSEVLEFEFREEGKLLAEALQNELGLGYVISIQI